MPVRLMDRIEWQPIQHDVAIFFRPRVANKSDVDDLTQDVIVTALKCSDNFIPDDTEGQNVQQQVTRWIMGIAKKKYQEYLKNIRRRHEVSDRMGDFDQDFIESTAIAPLDRLRSEELASLFKDAVMNCPPSLRSVAHMYLTGCKLKDIAEKCGLPIGRVHTKVSRLRKHIADYLRKRDIDTDDCQVIFRSSTDETGVLNEFLAREIFPECSLNVTSKEDFDRYLWQSSLTDWQRTVLLTARSSVDTLGIDRESHIYVTEQLVELTIELQKSSPSCQRVKRYASLIQQVSESLGELLRGLYLRL